MTYRDPATLPSSPSCPRDGSVLTVVEDVIARLCCPRCHGEWLQSEQIVALASRPDVQARFDAREAVASVYRGDGSKTLACPECHTAMRRHEYGASRVAVDVCRRHGLWLDVGELSRVASYLRHYAQKVAPDDVAGALRGPRRDAELDRRRPALEPVDAAASFLDDLLAWFGR